MTKIDEKTIGQIAAENYNACEVFDKYRIDYFNKGKQNLEQIATEGKANIDSLLKEIEIAGSENNVGEDTAFNLWDLDALSNYIVRVHHKYAEKQIQEIKPKLEHLIQQHGQEHPELIEIKKLFDTAAGAIAAHQKKEELMLFPFIRKMADAKRNNKPFIRPPLTKSAENPVNMLTHEHTQQADAFDKIVELSNNYAIPDDADENYKELMSVLKEFELHLHRHLHLENNILFPKALKMDKELFA
jgi:regulator of cell morphogenesis and NO signaling